MKISSLFSVLIVTMLLAFGTSYSFAQTDPPTASAFVQDDGGVPIVSDAMIAPDDLSALATESKMLPVCDGIVSYKARVRSAYWPRERTLPTNTKGYWPEMYRSVARSIERLV